jgi:hypothetical protein
MESLYKNRVVLIVLIACVAFSFSLNASKAGETGSLGSSRNIEGGEEILVAKDVGGGRPDFFITWCGNDALIIRDRKFVTELMDLKGNRIIISEKAGDSPLNCTPDGEWFIYEDRESARMCTDKEGEPPEPIVDDGEVANWQELVMDLYRYEIATGKRQKFAVAHQGSGSLVSPDGSKVLILNREDSTIDMPEPKWEPVWLKNEWGIFSKVLWFADSSGVVAKRGMGIGTLGVESFGEDGWTKIYEREQHRLYRVSLEAVDSKKRFYLITRDTFGVSENTSRTKYRLLRCTIKYGELNYEELNVLDDNGKRIFPLNILPDGSFVFTWKEDSCIYRLKPGEAKPECITDTHYEGDAYESIFLRAVSPDGRRIAFLRGKRALKPDGRINVTQHDLFVKEISED